MGAEAFVSDVQDASPSGRNRMQVELSGESYFPAIAEGEITDVTAGDLLRKVAEEQPEHVALAWVDGSKEGRRSWTYRELLAQSERAARALLSQFRPGERVAIWSANRPEWAIFQLGATFAGLTIVPINPANKAMETDYILRQSRSAGLFYTESYRDVDAQDIVERSKPTLPDLRATFSLDKWEAFVTMGDRDAELPDVLPTSPALILYTSGTTGKPKGAVLAHRAVLNTAKFGELRFALPRNSTWLNCVPMFHMSGCVFALMCSLWNRGVHLMLPGFDPKLVLRAIEEEKANWIAAVPTMAIALLDDPDRPIRDLTSLQIVVSGGTSVPAELVRRIEHDLGADFVMVFGQTEMSGVICQSMRNDTDHHRSLTVGIPYVHTEARIADRVTNATLPLGEIGEICLRGYATLIEYFDMPEATAGSFDAEGWFHTGDMGTMEPDGYMTITGRLKEMVIRGGENIYPREVEDVLVTHPAIADAAIFGVPDEKWGEQLVAAVRLRPGGEQATEEELKSFLRERIARQKVPAYWWFVDSYPTTASGKIQKFELRAMYCERLAKAAA
jgi:fatty-acyl-CoA synthase